MVVKIWKNKLREQVENNFPKINIMENASESESSEENSSEENMSETNSSEDVSETEESLSESSSESNEMLPRVLMTREAETEGEVHFPSDEEEIINEEPRRQQPKKNGKRSISIFTIDDIPSSQWENRFQEFHAWITVRNLTVDSAFDILSEFTAHLVGVLKDWWNSLGDNDKTIFLTRQDFSQAIEILNMTFLGSSNENKEIKRKEFFQMKCQSYERKDLSRHFKRMTQIFYVLGADINLKQAFLTSLPHILSSNVEIYIHNRYGSILNLTVGQIRQAVFLSLEEFCNKRKVIREYMKRDGCMDQACKKPELIIKSKCKACSTKKKERFSKFSKQKFRKIKTAGKFYKRGRKWKFFKKKNE